MPTTYPNQKTITVHRDIPKSTKNNNRPYMIIYSDVIAEASRNIQKPTAFKVYLYLVGNQDLYSFALSTQDIADTYGISARSAREAIADLIDAGYLVYTSGHHYEFYERPQSLDIDIAPTAEIKKKFSIGGEPIILTYSEYFARYGNGEVVKNIWEATQEEK